MAVVIAKYGTEDVEEAAEGDVAAEVPAAKVAKKDDAKK